MTLYITAHPYNQTKSYSMAVGNAFYFYLGQQMGQRLSTGSLAEGVLDKSAGLWLGVVQIHVIFGQNGQVFRRFVQIIRYFGQSA